ncbi:MAG: hypothetical protein GXP50_00800 [Deltaproteobacteria bacterium]|nr:hypothetical protein [Deltaproteobacteria bacterium]
MFTIPYNTTVYICAAIVLAIIGFVVYGCIVGFENTFKDFEEEHRSGGPGEP